MNTRQKKTGEAEYEIEEILNKRVTDDGKLEYFLKWKGFPKSESTWEPIENLNCPEMLKNYEESLKSKHSTRKRSFINLKKDGSNGAARKKKSEAYNNNTLPEEILIKIFSYLRQNDLGRMALVCKRWNVSAKTPVLWKNIAISIRRENGSFNEILSCVLDKIPTFATKLLIDFTSPFDWKDHLHFEEFCKTLKEICPCLESLALFSAEISLHLPYAIDIANYFFPNLKVLSFRECEFGENLAQRDYCGISKVKILDLSFSLCKIFDYEKQLNIQMPFLKKLYLGDSTLASEFMISDTSRLQQLDVLSLGWTTTIFQVYEKLQSHALNLTSLFLCSTDINDEIVCFNNSGFPKLKTICLRNCDVTSQGIRFLIQSCPCLQNVYVTGQHVFNVTNKKDLDIVKAIDICNQHLDLSYAL